jgi:O-phosphoseryl-tRNA(Sec) selenium transferase, SepSecS
MVELLCCAVLEVRTDITALEAGIMRLGAGSVAAVVTTASCFAPRGPDKLVDVVRTPPPTPASQERPTWLM